MENLNLKPHQISNFIKTANTSISYIHEVTETNENLLFALGNVAQLLTDLSNIISELDKMESAH